MPVVHAEPLTSMAVGVFRAVGVGGDEARLVSELLVKANLAGVDSHGVIRIPEYVKRVREGRVRPGAEPRVVRETRSTALVDGKWGFGQVIGVKAMEVAIAKARENAVGAVGIFNSNHLGRLADYPMTALRHDMVGFAVCNSGASVAPFGGVEPLLNPGPISFAIPAGLERPIVLDMTTSVCAWGKVAVKRRRGEKTPPGWLIDRDGNPTRDPEVLLQGGTILPLGGDVGYKGFGLGLVVDILAGALTDSGCASSEEYVPGANGAFMMAVDIGSFTSIEKFKERVDNLIRRMKASRKAPGFDEILMPGEPEFREEERRLREGIFIEEPTWREITTLAGELGVETPPCQ